MTEGEDFKLKRRLLLNEAKSVAKSAERAGMHGNRSGNGNSRCISHVGVYENRRWRESAIGSLAEGARSAGDVLNLIAIENGMLAGVYSGAGVPGIGGPRPAPITEPLTRFSRTTDYRPKTGE